MMEAKDIFEYGPFTFDEMDVDLLEKLAYECRDRGYTRWATTTDKTQNPWKITMVFWNEVEK